MRNVSDLTRRFILTKGRLEILNGHISVFEIHVVPHIPQLPPQPERRTFREEIHKKAECSKEQIANKRNQ
jgi:hypothetical protein